MAYVYRHIRLDKNEVFYIGIGSDVEGTHHRAFGKGSRNYHWNNVVNVTEYEVEILFDDISWDEAIKKEREFIQIYGRRDLKTGSLVNMTDGGEGILNFSEESRLKIIQANTGRIFSEERKKNISESKKGKRVSEETKQKISKTLTGKKIGKHKKPRTEEHCQKLRDIALRRKKMSDETKLKISKTLRSKFTS